MKSLSALSAALVLAFAAAAQASPPVPAYIASAVADTSRPQADRDKDAVRHPAELLTLSGIKPGDVVVDVWPGGGYWTRLFARIVGPKGHVYEYVPQEIASSKRDPVGVAKATAAEPGMGNVEVIVDPLTSDTAGSDVFDIVWTFENYHDLHNLPGADVALFDRLVFKALKPGGAYVVGDHAAAAGSGLANTSDLHRIDPAAVKAEVDAAGFRLAAHSDLLANTADLHTLKIFDPAIKDKTDRFVFVFRKPKS
jgi:predicted methyltransferase